MVELSGLTAVGSRARAWLIGLIIAPLTIIASVYSPAPLAGSVDLYNIAGRGHVGHISKPVTSLRQQKFTDLVEQRYDFSCGAAATATVLRYAYGMDVGEADVLLGMASVSDEELVREKGFSLLDIRHYVETLGLRGRGYEIPPASLFEIRIPTIVLLDIRGYKHFVVLRRVVEDQVFVGDPALGNRTMTMEDFIDSWNGTVFAIVGKGFDRDTVLSRPEPPLTVHQLFYDRRPLSDSELLDFGFQHADLF